MTYSDETINALARLRKIAEDGRIGMFAQIAADLDTLDNAGVFAALDEQTDYAAAVDILAEAAREDVDQLVHNPAVCFADASDSPALHAGTCPVWTQHHGLI